MEPGRPTCYLGGLGQGLRLPEALPLQAQYSSDYYYCYYYSCSVPCREPRARSRAHSSSLPLTPWCLHQLMTQRSSSCWASPLNSRPTWLSIGWTSAWRSHTHLYINVSRTELLAPPGMAQVLGRLPQDEEPLPPRKGNLNAVGVGGGCTGTAYPAHEGWAERVTLQLELCHVLSLGYPGPDRAGGGVAASLVGSAPIPCLIRALIPTLRDRISSLCRWRSGAGGPAAQCFGEAWRRAGPVGTPCPLLPGSHGERACLKGACSLLGAPASPPSSGLLILTHSTTHPTTHTSFSNAIIFSLLKSYSSHIF